MSRYEHGRVLAVNEKQLGSELVAAHTAGVMSLTVEDPVDFDEDGGHLMIADQVIEYSTYDDDTGEITLLSALAADATNSESVWLYDALFQTITTELLAEVELDGDDDNTDALECVIAHHLVDMVPEGIRGLRGESVLLEQDGDEWRIVDVLGLAANGASGTQFWNDRHAVAAPGQQTISLTHEPIDNSEHVYWNGLYQPASEWTRNGQTVTVPDSGGLLIAGDEFVVEYAYRVGAVAPRVEEFTSSSDVPFAVGSATAGGFLVAAAFVRSGVSYSTNGYTATETASVTHNVGGTDNPTYKLVVFSGPFTGTLPSVGAHTYDQPWVLALLNKGSGASVQVSTVADASSAATPATTSGRVVRVWAAMGDNPYIDAPDTVTVKAGLNPAYNPASNSDLQIVLACDDNDSGGQRTATSPISAGWMLAAVTID